VELNINYPTFVNVQPNLQMSYITVSGSAFNYYQLVDHRPSCPSVPILFMIS
jgi:hypothetical protein